MLSFLSGATASFLLSRLAQTAGQSNRFFSRHSLSPIDSFSLDRAFNEFPVISFYTPAAFIDFGVFRYVPFGPYLLDFCFIFPYGPLPFIGIISFRFYM